MKTDDTEPTYVLVLSAPGLTETTVAVYDANYVPRVGESIYYNFKDDEEEVGNIRTFKVTDVRQTLANVNREIVLSDEAAEPIESPRVFATYDEDAIGVI